MDEPTIPEPDPARQPALVRYDAARQALAAAHRVDEAKGVRDRAVAIAAYARQARDDEMIRWATEIKLRAERRAGELLREAAATGTRHKGKAAKGRKASSPDDTLPKLADLGITRDQSSAWQKVAALPEAEFEARLRGLGGLAGGLSAAGGGERTTRSMLTTSGMLRGWGPPVDWQHPPPWSLHEAHTRLHAALAREMVTCPPAERAALADLFRRIVEGMAIWALPDPPPPTRAAVAAVLDNCVTVDDVEDARVYFRQRIGRHEESRGAQRALLRMVGERLAAIRAAAKTDPAPPTP